MPILCGLSGIEVLKAALYCPFPVVGTGVDPVTSRFSAALGTIVVDRLKLVRRRNLLAKGYFALHFDVPKYPLFLPVSHSCGHVVGTKRHTPYRYVQIVSVQNSRTDHRRIDQRPSFASEWAHVIRLPWPPYAMSESGTVGGRASQGWAVRYR